MSNDKIPAESPVAEVLTQTNKVGRVAVEARDEMRAARQDLAETHAVVLDIHNLITPQEAGEENPVLETLEQILLALQHQQTTLDTINRRLAVLEERL